MQKPTQQETSFLIWNTKGSIDLYGCETWSLSPWVAGE